MPAEYYYPYVRTEGLMAACNTDALENEKTKHVAEAVCHSYLNAVIDSLEAQHYRVKVPSVCMPDSEELLEQKVNALIALSEEKPDKPVTPEEKAEAMNEYAEQAAELGGSLPMLNDVLVLYRGYVTEEPIYGLAPTYHWRIALHRTPFETVSSALHEAWPCENYNADSDGYHVIFRILEQHDLLF